MPKTNITISADMDGNAFAIMGTVCTAMAREGYPAEMIEEYKKEAMSGDYDHLLQTTFDYVEIE